MVHGVDAVIGKLDWQWKERRQEMERKSALKGRFRALGAVCPGMLLVGLSACATQGRKTEVRTEHDAVVTVESIDVPNRLVTVRDASGESSMYYVDESIRTFPQAKVGDQVRIRYQESLALQMKKPGETSPEWQVKEETARPQPSQPARGSTRTEAKATVKIDRIDRKANTVTFTGPRGRRTVLVTDPALQDFVKKLSPGDDVEVVFSEALALSLEPVRR